MCQCEGPGKGADARRCGFSQQSSGKVMAASSSKVCTCARRGGGVFASTGVQWGSGVQSPGIHQVSLLYLHFHPHISIRFLMQSGHHCGTPFASARTEFLALDSTRGSATVPAPGIQVCLKDLRTGSPHAVRPAHREPLVLGQLRTSDWGRLGGMNVWDFQLF